MARKPITDMSAWPSLSIEGNLIAPAMIAKIDQRAAPEQDPENYSVRKGLTIREEISTAFRVGQSHFDAFAKIATPTQDATRRFISSFFKETFGYDDLEATEAPVALIAGGRVPVVVVPATETLDRRSPTLSVDRSRSPAFALQDYLNDKDEALWGIVTNGTHLRLMRDNASLTRPAYIEADLAQIFINEDIASFAVLWLLIHRSRFGTEGSPATDCPLERWRDTGAKEGEVARDRLAAQVQISLKVLGSGFLEANPGLATGLKSGEVNLTEWFNELLRLVYRLIFLMVAEDRNLLHPTGAKPDARALYAQGYSLAALRKQCYRAATWDKHHDRYEAIKIVFHALAHGQPALALPALGGLFADDRLPHLKTARLRNKAFMEALYRLSWLSDKSGMVPVNWRAMETEELGSVYETLLELQPQLGDDGKTLVFAAEAAEQKGNQRKTTGSYYTPDSLVQALLDTTLDPVLDKTDPDKLLNLSIIDPACGSGHFLLAAARRVATRLARHRAEGTPALSDFRHALRDVARSCLHGVDRNPMAVELTKVALWIETVDPGLPLGFFDANIRCGDSLMGVSSYGMLRDGLPDAAYEPLTGDDKAVAKEYRKINKEQREGVAASGFIASLKAPAEITDGAARVLAMPEDTLAQIEAKSRAWNRLLQDPKWWTLKTACDMYVAAFLMPKTGDIPDARAATMPIPTTEAIWRTIKGGDIRSDIQAACIDLSESARAFHWPLEFPAQMATGGFDVVLGNPPWERIKLQEQEFFAARDADIASAANKAARGKLIKALKETNPALAAEFQFAKRTAEAASLFARKTGRFPLTGTGDVNTYALFAEHFSRLARQIDGAPPGHAGVVVPTGIATDSSTSAFFGDLVTHNRLMALYDFENRQALFPGVHRSYKFSILAIGPARAAKFAAYLLNTGMLANADRQISLTADDFTLFNPNTRTAPLFRARADKALTRKLYEAAPVLIRARPAHPQGDANPWGITFQTLFHMSGDSGYFRTAAQLSAMGFERDGPDWRGPDGQHYLPLFEAKMIHHYDHRYGSYAGLGARPKDGSLPEVSDAMRANPEYEAEPWYWVPAEETELRVARVPQRLKGYLRKENPEGCLKVLAEWVLSSLDPDDLRPENLARTAPLATARLREVLGERAVAREILGATFATWLGKAAAGARKMALETPLSADDLHFVKQGPKPALDLARALIGRKQPRWLMGWRDITNATNERTVIASVFPKVGVGHTMPLIFTNESAPKIAVLIAQLTSLPFDYSARQKLAGTHLTYTYINQLPVLAPHQFSKADLAFLTPRVLELTYTSHAMRPWAEDLGHTGAPFIWDPERRAGLKAEIDAFFARKYGLRRDELRYILDPADVKGEDYPSQTFRGLQRGEIEKYGEYRTRRLVLAAWDAMEAGGVLENTGLAGREIPASSTLRIELPPLAQLPEGAWAWPASVQPADRIRVAAQYALWLADPDSDGQNLRWAIACLAEPALLSRWLNGTEQAEWIRLMGAEAQSAQNITRLRPPINAAWREAFETLVSTGQLQEGDNGEWAKGQHFGSSGLRTDSAHAQRAMFVLEAIRRLDMDRIRQAAPEEDNVIWARFGHG